MQAKVLSFEAVFIVRLLLTPDSNSSSSHFPFPSAGTDSTYFQVTRTRHSSLLRPPRALLRRTHSRRIPRRIPRRKFHHRKSRRTSIREMIQTPIYRIPSNHMSVSWCRSSVRSTIPIADVNRSRLRPAASAFSAGCEILLVNLIDVVLLVLETSPWATGGVEAAVGGDEVKEGEDEDFCEVFV